MLRGRFVTLSGAGSREFQLRQAALDPQHRNPISTPRRTMKPQKVHHKPWLPISYSSTIASRRNPANAITMLSRRS